MNRGRSGSACGGVEIPIRRWVNIIDHRYSSVGSSHSFCRLFVSSASDVIVPGFMKLASLWPHKNQLVNNGALVASIALRC